ncbi:MAG: hypothetical protein RL173_110 [Fibrobacterota bacterium]
MASALPAYWQSMNKPLWDAYGGTCAYLSIFFEWSTGASSTDHFIAKSSNAGAAYEWSNYRLACLGANRSKNKFDDVLDPIGLAPETFHLNLLTGHIRPNPSLGTQIQNDAQRTIDRLKLNDPETMSMRARFFSEYVKQDRTSGCLKKYAPFVWYEADRQEML